MELPSRLTLHQLSLLDALLDEESVTRAARRLRISQPAVSQALASLREQLGDPLLVPGAGRMVRTARADALRAPLRRALYALQEALHARALFTPADCQRRFSLAMPDAYTITLLPGLLARVQAAAPGVDLEVVPVPKGGGAAALEEGALDLSFEVGPEPAPGLMARALYEERFVCVVREGHPAVGDTLDLDTFVRLPHALISPQGHGQGRVDTALAALGLQRRIALRCRYFLAAPLVVAQSDLILTAPERLAQALAAMAPLRILPPPLALPRFQLWALWHARSQDDPAHAWLRGQLAEVARAEVARAEVSRGAGG